ncbi:MAG: trypsin-like peptidase domain-containing protein [Blastocatellia bacterium]
MFVYLSGSEKGKTRIFTQEHLTIGTSDESDLKIVAEEGAPLPDAVMADVFFQDGSYQLVPRAVPDQYQISVNGNGHQLLQSNLGYPLRDGDTLFFGDESRGASLLFQVLPDNFNSVHPVRREVHDLESTTGGPPAHPHPLTATLFVKELTVSLWAEVPRRAKLTMLLTLGFLVLLAVGLTAYAFLTLHRVARQNELLTKQSESTMAHWQESQDLIQKQQMEIDRLRQVSDQTRQFAQTVFERYSPGVCLIVGTYTFAEKSTGRLLRYESADFASTTPVDRNGNLLASVDGAGPPVELEFSGTGFVLEEGLLVSNRHVVEPWASDQTAQVIMSQGPGFKPKLEQLVAFFPSGRQPFELKVAETSDRYDIALCSFDQGATDLPALPLSNDNINTIIGEPVVLLGYPTGVDGLLQRIDKNERQAILSEHGKSIEDVAAGLATRSLIRPLTTTGIVSDALPGRIVHSAHTTEGGSGGPLFDRDDRVIAINSAILAPMDGGPAFGGSNFGVPIKAVAELVQAYHKSDAKK